MAGSHFCKARQGKQSVRGARVLEKFGTFGYLGDNTIIDTISKMALENFGKGKKP